MTMLRIVVLFFLLAAGSASRPLVRFRVAPPSPPDCLQPGTWGNDWPLCGRIFIKNKIRGEQKQRLTQEMRLKLKDNGTGEMSFFFCPTQERIPRAVEFTYRVDNERINFNWTGSKEDIWLAAQSFNNKTSFKVSCSQDTLFIDSLMNNTVYRGATYFIRRN